MNVFHNSHELKYREPFGAVPTGEEVKLCIDADSFKSPVSCFLIVKQEGGKEERFSMQPEEPGSTRFAIRIKAPAEGTLLWYYFMIRQSDGKMLFYGNNDAEIGGVGRTKDGVPASYQITVYEKDPAPEWYADSIVYQIFPDRFNRGQDWEKRSADARRPEEWIGPTRILQENWNDTPFYTKNELGQVTRWAFFGGTLEGVREKLLYLKSLGVGVLYLNPIFKASSNHKYDTADYKMIDPGFGDEESFKALVQAAENLGISIILDGVFNHTGADSIYFNKYGNYSQTGACQGEKSPYFSWYHFSCFPGEYDSWWGVADLPQTDKNNESYRNFIFGETDSVVRHWMKMGARGWRLDVADELPDEFIGGIRKASDETVGDGVLIGEVWEDASNKISYALRRKYLLGGKLHSVTNYPFRLAGLDFMLGKISAFEFTGRLMSLKENYPPESFSMALNLIGSHDRDRILTLLGDPPNDLSDLQKEFFRLPPEKHDLAKKRLKLLSLIQFTAHGVPCIYYGDEAGSEGFAEPYNRAPYPWGREDAELLGHYRSLGLLRSQFVHLRRGAFSPKGMTEHVFALSRRYEGEELLLLANRGIFEHESVTVETEGAYILDLLSSEEHEPENGRLTFMMEPLSAKLLYMKKLPEKPLELTRAAGTLCPLSAVPSANRLKKLSEVYSFIDFLTSSGQTLWQILPLNPRGKGRSPFCSSSSFALDKCISGKNYKINAAEYDEFCRENAYWLDDHALYKTLKKSFGDRPWQEWPKDERDRTNLSLLIKKHSGEIEKIKKDQFVCQCLWLDIKKYANERGIKIIGDLPIYMAMDSADVWARRGLFRLNENGSADLHAGVPPDYFCCDGQDWGNPLYNWETGNPELYLFWEKRLNRAGQLYDVVRLDHFRSFSAFYAIPDGLPPSRGHWLCGPGIGFFEEMRRRLGALPVIAEDLGMLDTNVTNLMKLTGFPGMLVWQFSAEEMERMTGREAKNRIFYSGTHDNQTLLSWCADNDPEFDPKEKADQIIEKLYASEAPWVILPLQDVLGLDDSARINIPGDPNGNWDWKADETCLTADVSERFCRLAEKHDR